MESNNVDAICRELDEASTRLTRIRAMAAEIGKDKALASGLWKTGKRNHRLLAILVSDPKKMDGTAVAAMADDIDAGPADDRDQLSDWLLSNVIMKNPRLREEADRWERDPSVTRLRLYWQLRARSIDGADHAANRALLDRIQAEISAAHPRVQWTMNWCAASIGIEDETLRGECVRLGESTGLYRDYPTPKGCTSPYLPLWIGAVTAKKRMK